MARAWPISMVLCLSISGGGAAAEGPDPEVARALGTAAHAALRANAPDEAARLFDEAHAIEPQALWQVAAGQAWLDAGEPATASVRLEGALEAGVPTAAQREVAELLAVARALAPIVAKARALEAKGASARAMSASEEAFAVRALGRFLALAARAADRAARDGDVRRLAEVAAQRTDLPRDDARWLASVLTRVRQVPVAAAPKPEPEARVGPWIVIGSGLAVAVGGGVALLVADGARGELRDMKASAEEGVVLGPTRAHAVDKAAEAETWTVAGGVALGVGAAIAGVGVGWLIAGEPAAVGRAEVVGGVRVMWIPGGAGLTAAGSF
ncbi:MAG: hypothetical protein IT385_10625 [Deltaproteobacteria bacterium]|nr:hypothetical protein [Deltaproteobacteria bacterium]